MPFDHDTSEFSITARLFELRDPILHAARFLGGPASEARTLRLFDRLQIQPFSSRIVRRELRFLQDLLSNQLDHEFEGGVSFCSVDPNDPCVEEICLLADQVAEILAPILK